MAKMLHY